MKKSPNNPTISVIMATFDSLPYLKDAVESILKQTFKNFEFIIVNDASNDATASYLKSLKDSRIKVITNKKNLGLAQSLNEAIRAAKGEYIARMDADDISLTERLKTQLEFLEKHPEIDLCGAWVDLINEEDQIVGEKRYPVNNAEIKQGLKWYQPIVHPTFMAREIIFRKLGGYDPNFDYAEDYEFLSRAMKKYQFANIPKKLLKWRLADERRSRRSMKKVDIADYKVKVQLLKKNYFGKSYIFYVILKFITTFLFPSILKKTIAKRVKLA